MIYNNQGVLTDTPPEEKVELPDDMSGALICPGTSTLRDASAVEMLLRHESTSDIEALSCVWNVYVAHCV